MVHKIFDAKHTCWPIQKSVMWPLFLASFSSLHKPVSAKLYYFCIPRFPRATIVFVHLSLPIFSSLWRDQTPDTFRSPFLPHPSLSDHIGGFSPSQSFFCTLSTNLIGLLKQALSGVPLASKLISFQGLNKAPLRSICFTFLFWLPWKGSFI